MRRAHASRLERRTIPKEAFPLLYSYVEGVWSTEVAPFPASSASANYPQLSSVACPVIGACIAVGSYEPAQNDESSFIVTESDGSWTASQAPISSDAATQTGNELNLSSDLNDLACGAPGSCVAFGDYEAVDNGHEGLSDEALTLTNGTWTVSPVSASKR